MDLTRKVNCARRKAGQKSFTFLCKKPFTSLVPSLYFYNSLVKIFSFLTRVAGSNDNMLIYMTMIIEGHVFQVVLGGVVEGNIGSVLNKN